jgi:hypothetical protein
LQSFLNPGSIANRLNKLHPPFAKRNPKELSFFFIGMMAGATRLPRIAPLAHGRACLHPVTRHLLHGMGLGRI